MAYDRVRLLQVHDLLVHRLRQYCYLPSEESPLQLPGSGRLYGSDGPHRSVDCEVRDKISLMLRIIAMACASLLLMLRAIALWERDRRVVVPLVVLHLGQWGRSLF